MKKLIVFLLMLAGIFFIACGTNRPQSIIKGIAIEENNGRLKLTANIVEDEGYLSISSSGRSIGEAVRNLSSVSGKEAFLGQNEVLLISSEIPQEKLEKLIKEYFTNDKRRGSEFLAVFSGKAEELFGIEDAEGLTAALKTASEAAIVPKCTLSAFVGASESISGSVLIPEIKTDDEGIHIEGGAVYKEYKCIYSVEDDALKGAMLMLSAGKDMVFTVEPDATASLLIDSEKISVSFREDPTLVFDIKLCLQLETIGKSSVRADSDEELLNSAAERYIKLCLKKLFAKVRGSGSDFINLAARTANLYEKLFKSYGNSWEKLIKMADYEVEVHCETKMPGLVSKPEEPEE